MPKKRMRAIVVLEGTYEVETDEYGSSQTAVIADMDEGLAVADTKLFLETTIGFRCLQSVKVTEDLEKRDCTDDETGDSGV